MGWVVGEGVGKLCHQVSGVILDEKGRPTFFELAGR